MSKKIPIKNLPQARDLWKGIGGHFDSFDQMLCEFVDNAISNFDGNKSAQRTVIVSITQKNQKTVLISIEDSGSGIKDLDSAFSLGNTSGAETPLNEHGFGMKHALASANPGNDNWYVYTRTENDYTKNHFKKISNPYDIQGFGAVLVSTKEENWPGKLNGSGTFITFECSWDLFYTIRAGVVGAKSQFPKLIEMLSEDLGFIYAGLIQENKATITIQSKDLGGNTHQSLVKAITPDWRQFYEPGQGSEAFDLGGGNIKIKYAFGSMNAAESYKYYRRNMSSSGLEIRLNGRILSYNLFKEVWGLERHNMYNHLLVTVDLISNERATLPSTRTSKNGLREGDGKLEALYNWVRNYMKEPKKDVTSANDENDLFEELKKAKQIHLPDPKVVTLEQKVYREIKEKIRDLYTKLPRLAEGSGRGRGLGIHGHRQSVKWSGYFPSMPRRDIFLALGRG